MRKCLFLFAFLLPLLSMGQKLQHSWDGKGLYPKAHIRTLNIFANIIFDVDSTMDPVADSQFWHKITNPALAGVNVQGTEPSYLLNYMDTVYVPGQTHGTITRIFGESVIGNTNGCITRIYGESSFDTLQISGDNVVVNVRESRVIADPTPPIHTYCQTSPFCYNKIKKVAIDVINEAGGLKTVFGHDSLSDYSLPGSQTLYYTNVLIRNITRAYGGINNGSGFNGITIQGLKIGNLYYSSQKGTLQCIGDGNFSTNPTGVLTHEIGHSLFGHND